MTSNVQDLSNEQLISEVQQGHQWALDSLYDCFVNRVYGMAIQKLADPAEAENITHDIFVTLWRRSGTFRPEAGTVAGWFLTMAHNRINDQYRRKRRSGEIQDASSYDPVESAGESVTQPEEAQSARQALQGLPDKQLEVVVLSYYQGLSQIEIAQRLGVPEETVRSRMSSAMTGLRSSLHAGGN